MVLPAVASCGSECGPRACFARVSVPLNLSGEAFTKDPVKLSIASGAALASSSRCGDFIISERLDSVSILGLRASRSIGTCSDAGTVFCSLLCMHGYTATAKSCLAFV